MSTATAPPKPGMLLRTQLAIIVTAVLMVISCILIGFAELRAGWLNEQYQTTLRNGDARSLETLALLDGRILARTNRDLRELAVTRDAVVATDPAEIAPFTAAAVSLLRLLDPAPTIALMNANFEPIETVGSLAPQNAAIALRQILRGKRRMASGLLDIPGVGLANIHVTELRVRDQVAGYLMTMLSFQERIRAFAQGDVAFLFAGPGSAAETLSGATRAAFRQQITCCVNEPETLRWSNDGIHIIASIVPLVDAADRPVGNLIVARDISDKRNREILLSRLSHGGVAVLILLSATFMAWSLRTAFRPLYAMVGMLQHLSKGDTSVSMKPIRTNKEISRLAETVESFRIAQKAQQELVSVTEQIANASRIQQSILPTNFEIDPRVDTYAVMIPAQDIGGDFFDVFMIDADHLCVLVADVSGKGMGAALFASSASALLRSQLRQDQSPAKTLARVNNDLCERNEEGLFLTVFLAKINLDTGAVEYANAGHPPPFILQGGKADDLPPPMGDTAIGFFEDLEFATHRSTLTKDQSLLIFSDGFSEAMDPAGELLGVEGARRFTEQALSNTAGDLVRGISDAVTHYSDSPAGADDLTLIAVRLASQ